MNFFLKYLVFLCLFRYLQMKFLRTFNPRIDADAFIEALEQNWEWNVILIKRHRIKLILPLFFVCVSLWLLALMLYIIYVNIFESNKMIYRALTTFYLFTSLSWTWFTIYLIFYWDSMSNKFEEKILWFCWRNGAQTKNFFFILKAIFYCIYRSFIIPNI